MMPTIDIKDPDLYADWTEDQLSDHIKVLQEIQRQKGGYHPAPKKLSEMLSPDNPDFLGSGMSMMDWFMANDLQRLERSFYRAQRPERKRRLQYVIQLCLLLAEIEKVSNFGTAFARSAIEDIIQGDWAGVRHVATLQEFWGPDWEYVPADAQVHWRAFSAICQEAFDTRPDAPAPPKPKN